MKLASILVMASVAFAAVLPQLSHASHHGAGWSKGETQETFERRKKRVKGGSGCDDPGDVAEHPECR